MIKMLSLFMVTLTFLVGFSCASTNCPSGCKCIGRNAMCKIDSNTNAIHFSCSPSWTHVRLNLISSGYFKYLDLSQCSSVEYLTIGGKLSTLSSGKLKPFVQLRKLFIVNTGLSSIPNDAFAGLTKLHDLTITGHPDLSSLPPTVLNNLPLRRLILSETGLKSLDTSLLSSSLLAQHLGQLILMKNKIRRIDDNTFRGLNRLQTLDLSHNQLEFIGGLDDLISLTSLNLGYNNLTSFGTGANMITGLPSLDHLNLMYNSITSLANVAGFPTLSKLNLSHQKRVFSHFPLPREWRRFPGLSHLIIDGIGFPCVLHKNRPPPHIKMSRLKVCPEPEPVEKSLEPLAKPSNTRLSSNNSSSVGMIMVIGSSNHGPQSGESDTYASRSVLILALIGVCVGVVLIGGVFCIVFRVRLSNSGKAEIRGNHFDVERVDDILLHNVDSYRDPNA